MLQFQPHSRNWHNAFFKCASYWWIRKADLSSSLTWNLMLLGADPIKACVSVGNLESVSTYPLLRMKILYAIRLLVAFLTTAWMPWPSTVMARRSLLGEESPLPPS